MSDITYADVVAASKRLQGHAHKTPVFTSRTIDRLTGGKIFFKCENFQRTGAFKFRGAYNAISQLCPQDHRGVLTYSSGNHAQAVALVGNLLGIPTTIVMPDNAPRVKVEATREYGAEIISYAPSENIREQLGRKIAADRGLTIIPPYDHPHIIAGQGTVAAELIAEIEYLNMLLVPCGGGGLLSGCAITARTLLPECKVIGVEPEQADDATKSFYSKTLHCVRNPDTVADGARTASLGKITFPLVLQNVDEMLTVTEAEIMHSMHFIWERMKLLIEPTAALAVAAVLHRKIDVRSLRVGIVISGGNIDSHVRK